MYGNDHSTVNTTPECQQPSVVYLTCHEERTRYALTRLGPISFWADAAASIIVVARSLYTELHASLTSDVNTSPSAYSKVPSNATPTVA